MHTPDPFFRALSNALLASFVLAPHPVARAPVVGSAVAQVPGSAASTTIPGLPAAEPGEVGLSAEKLARISALGRQYVERGAMPGVLTVVIRDGRVAHFDAVGSRHVETGASLEPDTIFRIYSMTKPITGVAVMQLVERELLRLSDPVADYLPELADLEVWSGDAGDHPSAGSGAGADAARGDSAERARTMTIEHLLTHTSGLTYDDDSLPGVPSLYAEAELYSVADLASFVTRLARLPLAFQPGERWEYGVSMDVLGRVVEVASGKPFEAYLQDEVLGPLGMVDTGFHMPAEKVRRFAAMYRHTSDGGMRRVTTPEDNGYRDPRPVPFGGHGLISTASDYARFAWMLANGGELDGVRILSQHSVELMMRDHLGASLGEHPLASSWLGDSARGLGFGLTGAVVRNGKANGIPGSTGAFFWGGAASTFFFVDRARRLVGLQFTQLSPSDAYPIREEFRRLIYESLTDEDTR